MTTLPDVLNKQGPVSICIFGGSFNPPHLGHRMILNHLLLLPFDYIVVMPCHSSPEKQVSLPKQHRLALLDCFLEGFDDKRLSRCDYEINQGKTTHTHETVAYFIEKYPNAKLYFALGSDSFYDLPNWGGYDLLTDALTFVLLQRAEDETTLPPNTKVVALNNAMLDISSTTIRANINTAKAQAMLSPKVLAYIKDNHLYQG